jgi:hypothetical protein
MLSIVCAALAPAAARPIEAQTALLEVERADATKLMQVNDDAGMVVRGAENSGAIPASGPGTRLMWYPRRYAFRVGQVNGVQWDNDKIGSGSVAMGLNTTASGQESTALGGGSTASAYLSTAMGSETAASGDISTAMGAGTTASGSIATAMGVNSVASGNNSTAMGAGTRAAGNESTAMGSHTSALGAYSTAMGSYSAAFGSGSFAYGDRSTEAVVTALNDQFVVRASGGFRFRTRSDLSTGCDLQTGSGTWSCTSSRLAKERFEDVSGEEVLHRLRRLSIQRWSYLGLATRHIGPVAEEFYAAFALGEGPRTISAVDAAGVSLLAIQALERRSDELRQVYTALRAAVDSLTRVVDTLSASAECR